MSYTITALKDIVVAAITLQAPRTDMKLPLDNLYFIGRTDIPMKAGESLSEIIAVLSVQEASGSNRLDSIPHPKEPGGRAQGEELILIQTEYWVAHSLWGLRFHRGSVPAVGFPCDSTPNVA